jgi:Alternate to MurJ
MDAQLALILGLTFVIHLVDTLAYSVRIAGVRVRRLAVSLSLFNILVLLARTAGTVQAPLLARRVEVALHTRDPGLLTDLRVVLLAGSLATIAGALLIPTFQNAFTKAVRAFNVHRSIPRLLLLSFSKTGLLHLRDSFKVPQAQGVLDLRRSSRLPARLLVINATAVSAWTVAVLASLYAGYLVPEYRVTASSLAAVVSGVATVLLFVFSDPYLSALTDDVLEGKVSEGFFRRSVIWLVGSRLAGTLLAQLLLVPAALVISHLARGL